jgi:hypothetical protein
MARNLLDTNRHKSRKQEKGMKIRGAVILGEALPPNREWYPAGASTPTPGPTGVPLNPGNASVICQQRQSAASVVLQTLC